MSEADPASVLVKYVELMLSGVEELPSLSHAEKFEAVRAMTVAGLLYGKMSFGNGSEYHKELRAAEEDFDKTVVGLYEELAKYMRLRKLAGVE